MKKARKKAAPRSRRVSAHMLRQLEIGLEEHIKLAEAINDQLHGALLSAHGSAGWVRMAEIVTRHHAGGLQSLATQFRVMVDEAR